MAQLRKHKFSPGIDIGDEIEYSHTKDSDITHDAEHNRPYSSNLHRNERRCEDLKKHEVSSMKPSFDTKTLVIQEQIIFCCVVTSCHPIVPYLHVVNSHRIIGTLVKSD